MSALGQFIALCAPLFIIVLAGYVLAAWRHWRSTWTTLATRSVFALLLPALLFHMMSRLSALPPVDARLLVAFFGGCLIVFCIGRIAAARLFRLDGVSQSVFGLAGVFSNNALLGLPLAKRTLGDAAIPSVALVLVFNSLTLWTLVTVSVEWAKHGSLTLSGFGRTALGVLKNPLIAAILTGALIGLSGWSLPQWLDRPLAGLGQLAGPAALLTLGMGLAQYGFRRSLGQSAAICALKLLVMPLIVWALAAMLGLPALETNVVVLLASMSVGVNVHLMAVQFQTLQSAVASSLVLSTVLAVVTTPVILSALHWAG